MKRLEKEYLLNRKYITQALWNLKIIPIHVQHVVLDNV